MSTNFTEKVKAQNWLNSFRNLEVSKRPGKIISVTAGKGGVGKTCVAIKTAMELSQMDYRVLLLDCDFNLSNTSIKLGLPLNNNFYSLISSEKNFEECVHRIGNLTLLTGCNGHLDLIEKKYNFAQLVLDIIEAHQYQFDYIILDSPAGLSDSTLSLNAHSDHRFVVVTPDKSSLTDSYSLIKVLHAKYGIKENDLIVNMVDSVKQYERVVKSVSETVEQFLGIRTVILGGIKNYNGIMDGFDELLLYDKESTIHRNYIKIINTFTEKHAGNFSSLPKSSVLMQRSNPR